MDAAGGNVDLLVRLMSASAQRARVLAGNLANVNTPGYRRQTVQFEQLLADAQTSGDDVAQVLPHVEQDLKTPASVNDNNVVMELELSQIRENRIMYETYASMLQTHFEMLRTSVESGR